MSFLQTGIFNANPNHSASALHLIDEEFDVVISSHNLEHFALIGGLHWKAWQTE